MNSKLSFVKVTWKSMWVYVCKSSNLFYIEKTHIYRLVDPLMDEHVSSMSILYVSPCVSSMATIVTCPSAIHSTCTLPIFFPFLKITTDNYLRSRSAHLRPNSHNPLMNPKSIECHMWQNHLRSLNSMFTSNCCDKLVNLAKWEHNTCFMLAK